MFYIRQEFIKLNTVQTQIFDENKNVLSTSKEIVSKNSEFAYYTKCQIPLGNGNNIELETFNPSFGIKTLFDTRQEADYVLSLILENPKFEKDLNIIYSVESVESI